MQLRKNSSLLLICFKVFTNIAAGWDYHGIRHEFKAGGLCLVEDTSSAMNIVKWIYKQYKQ